MSETQSVDDVYYRVMHWMILDDFLRCVFDGSFNNKVVQNWKESPILSLSLHTKRNARQQTPSPSNNGSRRHRHRASEGVRARLRATGEKMHETRPTRVYAHREQDGVRCVLSINIIIIIIIALFFCVSSSPCLSIFWGKSNTYIYRDVVSLWVSPKNVLSPPPSKRDDRVYHVWVRRVLRETGLVSVSLRSLFTLNQQSHQYSFLDEIEYTDYGSFFPCRVAMRFDDARAKYLLTGVSFFILTQHTN